MYLFDYQNVIKLCCIKSIPYLNDVKGRLAGDFRQLSKNKTLRLFLYILNAAFISMYKQIIVKQDWI